MLSTQEPIPQAPKTEYDWWYIGLCFICAALATAGLTHRAVSKAESIAEVRGFQRAVEQGEASCTTRKHLEFWLNGDTTQVGKTIEQLCKQHNKEKQNATVSKKHSK